MSTPRDGLTALRVAADDGRLDELCARYNIRLMTVFGSVARNVERPHDLDIGVMLQPSAAAPDSLALVSDLVELTGTDSVDIALLNDGGPLIRERAFVGSIALFESHPGALAEAQVAAVLERMDTDWMRRLDLELMAG